MNIVNDFTKDVIPTPYKDTKEYGNRPLVYVDKPRHNLLGNSGMEWHKILNSGVTNSPTGLDHRQRLELCEAKLNYAALELVADFYVTNYLRFWAGTGMEEYNYALQDGACLINSKLRERVDLSSESTALKLGICLVDALDRSVRMEAKHAQYWESDEKEVIAKNKYMLGKETREVSYMYEMELGEEEWVKLFTSMKDAVEFDPQKCSLAQLERIYNAKWQSSFGGKVWANAVTALVDLKKVLLSKQHKDVVVKLDAILDMQHNTGNLLNKTEFSLVDEKFLDFRARTKNIGALVPYCSKDIKTLVSSLKRPLNIEVVDKLPEKIVTVRLVTVREYDEDAVEDKNDYSTCHVSLINYLAITEGVGENTTKISKDTNKSIKRKNSEINTQNTQLYAKLLEFDTGCTNEVNLTRQRLCGNWEPSSTYEVVITINLKRSLPVHSISESYNLVEARKDVTRITDTKVNDQLDR